MNIREHINNVLHLLKEPFSVIELAKAGCLPPVLHTSNIALLMHTDSKKIQEAFESVLKGLINNDILPAITVEEYINSTIEHERQRDATNYMESLPPSHLPPITAIALGHQDTDLLPGNAELNPKKWRMYLIRRDDFKKWLETEGEWPLPRENLLSRWWPDTRRGGNMYANIDATSRSKEDFYFRLEKDYWRIRFRGKPYTIKQSVGMQYITHLIERAYSDKHNIHVFDLYHLVKGRPIVKNTRLDRLTKEQLSEIGLNVAGLGNGFDVMTPDGKEWARNQMQQLVKAIEETEEYGNIQETLRLRKTKEALEDHIKKAYGLSGRARKTSDPNEKIRKAVSKAIENTLVRMGENDEDNLAVYLDDHLSKGLFCSFRKDPDIPWKIMKK